MGELRRIFAQQAFDAFRGDELVPGPAVQTDAELEDCIRASGLSGYHLCGTAKMGHDRMAVVDDQLRVHGVENVRVADASIIPATVTGNTNAATIMIAEKGSDLLLGRTIARAELPLARV